MQKSTNHPPRKPHKIFQLEYWLDSPSIQRIMLIVCLALTPGILVSIFVFGSGVCTNLLLSLVFGLILELAFHALAGRSIKDFPFDDSGAVMAIIFALSLPPSLPWWILLIGISFSITIGKYAYGGTGNNLFNPAMVGLAALLVGFPMEMNQWQMILNVPVSMVDAQSAATPLDSLQTSLRLSHTLSEAQGSGISGYFGAKGYEWLNLAFLCGGLLLIYKKIIHWHTPVGVLSGLFLITFFFHLIDADHYSGISFNLFGGSTMLCAFFVATDPVTSPITAKGRFIFGLLIGMIIYSIRTWGSYPEGVAFAVLMMNATVPLLDHYFKPQRFLKDTT